MPFKKANITDGNLMHFCYVRALPVGISLIKHWIKTGGQVYIRTRDGQIKQALTKRDINNIKAAYISNKGTNMFIWKKRTLLYEGEVLCIERGYRV